MTDRIDCSIIIPAYNAEKTVAAAVESALKDADPQIRCEVLVIDDGSTDGTGALIRELAQEHPSVRLLSKENGGVSSARNFALGEARGEYLYFMDADDTVSRPELDRIIDKARSTGADMIIADFEKVDPSSDACSRVKPLLPESELLDARYIRSRILPCFISGNTEALSPLWNKLYVRRKIIAGGLRFNEHRTHGEDWEFNIRYFETADSVYYEDRLLYRYIKNAATDHSKYKARLIQGYIEAYRLLSDMIGRYSLTEYNEHIVDELAYKTAFNFINALKIDGIPEEEKKALMRTEEAKSVFKKLSKADAQTLAHLSLSRKDKAAFLLLSKGKYHTALRII